MAHALVLGGMVGNATGLNADGLSLDLNFAADKSFIKPYTLAAAETQVTSRKGPSPIFTRGSAATLTGSDGLIQYAPENLLLQSEAFNNSWTSSNLNTTGTPSYVNAIAAPNGTLTADKIIATTGGLSHYFNQDFAVVSGVEYTYSCYFKAGEYTFGGFFVNGVSLFAQATNYLVYDLSNGTFKANTGGFVNVIITDAGNGWWRLSARITATGSGTANFRLFGNITGGATTNFVGDNSSGIYVWGAQLERSSNVKQYIPTTTSQVYGPRFDYDPVTLASKGLLIEEARTNLVFPSDTLTTQTRTVTASAHTLSFYGTGTIVISGAYVGTVTGTGAYPTRTSITFTPTAGSLTLTVTGSVVFTQLEAGSFATSYIPTTTGTVARSIDVCTIPSISSFYNATESTVFTEASVGSTSNFCSVVGFDNSSNTHQLVLAGFPPNTLNDYVIFGSTAQAQVQLSFTTNTFFKAAISNKLNSFQLSLNGTNGTKDTSGTMPTVSRFVIGASWNNAPINGHIKSIKVYQKALTDAKLITLTA